MDIVIVNFCAQGHHRRRTTTSCAISSPPPSPRWTACSRRCGSPTPTPTRYGGVYTFSSPADVDRFFASPLFADVAAHPTVDQPQVRRFQVMDEPTRVTRGLVPAGS